MSGEGRENTGKQPAEAQPQEETLDQELDFFGVVKPEDSEEDESEKNLDKAA